MRMMLHIASLLACLAAASAHAQTALAPADTLRAAYLATNPAQAQRNALTGEIRGVSFDLATELARRLGKPLQFRPLPSPPAVIEAVRSGEADIGFVAYEATRVGPVQFSQAYMLVQQSFIVPADSAIKAVADVDRPDLKIGGTRSDSVTLCMKRVLKHATIIELDSDPAITAKALVSGAIAAFGASRARLTAISRNVPGSRLLPDDFFNVPQTIVVPADRTEALAAVNAFIDDVRASGFLRDAVQTSGAVGVAPAPAGPIARHGCPG